MSRVLERAALVAATAFVVVVPAALAGQAPSAPPPPVTYGVIGDTPYGTAQIANFPNDVATINADPAVSLVIHVGDIKNGSTECNNQYFKRILGNFTGVQFAGLPAAGPGFADPLVYTPGDNEWTDCHRDNNGSYIPTERLDTVRRLFFDMPGHPLGVPAARSLTLDVQKDYPENVAWSAAGVQFGTVNVSGSNNDWQPWFAPADRTDEQVREYRDRNSADVKWLRSIFDAAKRSDAAGVVIAIQADMWDPAFAGANDDPNSYDHFTDFVAELARDARDFGKPTLLLNGDSHIFTDDRPLSAAAPVYQLTMYGIDKPVPNLRRITTNGSTTCPHEYNRLTVDASSPTVFSVTRVPFPDQPAVGCPAIP